MKIACDLVVVVVVLVSCCVHEVQPHVVRTKHHPTIAPHSMLTSYHPVRKTGAQNSSIKADELQVHMEMLRKENNEQISICNTKYTGDNKHQSASQGDDKRLHPRHHSLLWETEAKILQLEKKHPERSSLIRLPGLAVLENDEKAVEMNSSTSHPTGTCDFICPDAVSLAPCVCDPCTRNINCSAILSFVQLFTIFHTTYIPDARFEAFILVPPLHMDSPPPRSDAMQANTFGEATFTSIRVEGTWLREVEGGAFVGCENTLKILQFRWNIDLSIFPFSEIGRLKVLQKLEISGSSIASLPALPHTPRLSLVFLQSNRLTSLAKNAFAQLPSLVTLDLGYNSLYTLESQSLHFTAQDVMVFLDHNKIGYMHKSTFSGKQPAQLDVSDNLLASLDESVFRPVLDYIIAMQYNSYVDASGNPLCCSYITWLLENPIYLYYIILPNSICS